MTPEIAAASAARLAGDIDNAWTTDRRTVERARQLHLSAWAFTVAGRGGVLGNDVDPEAVTAALGLIAPDAFQTGWEAAGRIGQATVAAAHLAECAAWGRERLSGLADARLVELLERVVSAADATAMPIFAATRRRVLPSSAGSAGVAIDRDDYGGQVALLVHGLSEYRTAAMLVAGRVVGLDPVELLIGGPEGEQEAVTFGWSPPYPARLSVLRRYALATALADRMMGRALASLDAGERAELIDRLATIAAATVPGKIGGGASRTA